MAVIDVAEDGKYFSPHDANIGGVLCELCFKAVKFSPPSDTIVGECCNKVYTLAKENKYHLAITDKISE